MSPRTFRRRFYQVVTTFCILGLLDLGMFHRLMSTTAEASANVSAQACETCGETGRTRSNHGTQINVTGPSGVHINTWNGNLFYPLTLLTIPGRGFSLELSLSYNSGWRGSDVHYGYGWQLSYNVFYIRVENGDIIIVREGGHTDRFTKGNDGTFLSPLDTYDTLREYQPGKYVLRTQHGLEYYFDSPIHKRLSRLREPNGNALTFSYDENMRLTRITDTVGRRVELSYTGSSLITITDLSTMPNRSIQLQYDANRNLTAITDPLENTTTYGYDTEHFLSRITPPLGTTTNITYSNGTVTQIIGELLTKTLSYDVVNRITTLTEAAPEGNQVTRFFYDIEGRISSIEDPLGNRVSMVWDENNNLTRVTDALSRTTSYTYDAKGNLLSVTDALSNTTRYTYEGIHNRLIGVTDANGHATTYEYDSQGNLIGETNPLSNSTTYVYNSHGDLIGRTDANGRTTTYAYDDDGNLVTVTDPFSETTSYSYDTAGNLTGMTNTQVSVIYSYDASNRATNVNYVSHTKPISYTYNGVGNRTSMADPDGGVTTYAYDAASRPISLTNHLGQTTRYSYDSRGRLSRKDYHNGTYVLYTYDRANRLLSVVNKKSTGEVISSYTYEYDAVGNRTKMTEADGGVTSYTYDALNQLTKAVYPDGAFQEYDYDAIGNRLVLTDTTGTTSYSYDDADQLQSAGATIYGWDNNGNLITKTTGISTTVYAYDYENRLISITFSNSTTNTFTYYPDGRRLSKTDRSGQTTYYFYDGPNVILEADYAQATAARYTSGLGVDDWISMDRGGSSYFFHHDALDSVTGLTDPAGSIVATYQYDVFGSIRNQTGSVTNPFRFTGREYDLEAQLHNYRTRYYDAEVGRFTTKDLFPGKASVPLSMNKYLYVHNNPATFVDPYGASIVCHVVCELVCHFVFRLGHVICGVLCITVCEWINPPPVDGGGGGGCSGCGGGGTGGGGGGGIESKPLALAPSAFLEDSWASVPQPAPKSQSQSLVSLEDIIPTEGPEGTTAVPTVPVDVLAMTAPSDAKAMDFVDSETGKNKAAVLGIETIERPHSHDYAVCAGYHGYKIESVAPIPLPGLLPGATGANTPWFWYTAVSKDTLVEEAVTFVVFVNEAQKKFIVDSRWVVDNYPDQFSFDFDYIFNFQIWASSSEETYKLLQRAMENLANYENGTWQVSFLDTAEPPSPTIFTKKAMYSNDGAQLTVQSWLAETQTVTYYGSWRSYDDWNTSLGFSQQVSVPPGISTVTLPFENLLDVVIVSNVDGFLSHVYVGSGFWFAFSDEQSAVTMTQGNPVPITNTVRGDLILAGSVQVTGTITTTHGSVGVARTLNPNGVPVDISQYGALSFFARGDGKSYRARVETASIKDYDYYQFAFTAPPEWRQFVIPLSLFKQQGWGQTVPFTRTDVRTVAWESIGTPIDGSISLAFDKVAFANSTIISDVTRLSSTDNVSGPYTVTAKVSDDMGLEAVFLYYSVNNANTFTPVTMTANSDTFSASIPGQPLGTEVQYYVQATDADGNIATNPIDIPCMNYRFQVSTKPSLLVDNFCDTNPLNALEGTSGIFDSPATGTTITPYYDGESLRLDYSVTTYGGYYTRLNQGDLTNYNAVTFLVKGANGGEKMKVGLRDSLANESKLVLSQYLPKGITTYWQKVTIPLAAFARVVDWISMESFVVVFEDKIGSGTGTIYLDNIKFENIPPAPIVVDNFNDMTQENGVGGTQSCLGAGGVVINCVYDQANHHGEVGAGYRVTYTDVTETEWAIAETELLGLDASGYEFLSFYIKGARGDEKPNIYLAANGLRKFVNIENYVPITTSWQRVSIPLKDFSDQGLDITNLSHLQLAFEWEEMEGTVYLDDIRFNRLYPIFLPIVTRRR
jgi:RHS repeat-associated protein